MPTYSSSNQSTTQSVSGSQSTSSSSDSWLADAHDLYGNAALSEMLAENTAATDNTTVDLYANSTYPHLETKHDSISKDLNITMSESQMRDTRRFEEHWLRNKGRYQSVANQTGVPAKMIAALHWRESSGNFATYLHQGDPLGKPAVNWPTNIHVFHQWEEAAVHALNMKSRHRNNLGIDSSTTEPGKLGAYAELYNGLGYHNGKRPSPYVYSGSNAYTTGKYVADGRFSASTVDSQVGVVPLLGSIGGIESDQDLSPRQMSLDDAWAKVVSGQMVLKQGSNGMYVEALQSKLQQLGIAIEPDGDFGPGTKRKIIEFQSAHGLAADGIVGSGTAGKINSLL